MDRWIDGEHIIWKGLIDGQMVGWRTYNMERIDRWIERIDGQTIDRWLDGEHIVWKGLIDGQKGYATEQINLIKPKEFLKNCLLSN